VAFFKVFARVSEPHRVPVVDIKRRNSVARKNGGKKTKKVRDLPVGKVRA